MFETTIRVLGGLISGHVLLSRDSPTLPHYDGQLLRYAVDLADRLLPAFDTPSGLPTLFINLRRYEGMIIRSIAVRSICYEHGGIVSGARVRGWCITLRTDFSIPSTRLLALPHSLCQFGQEARQVLIFNSAHVLQPLDYRSGRLNDTSVTCTACAGTLLLEFGVLSSLTGNPVYMDHAHRCARVSGLVGGGSWRGKAPENGTLHPGDKRLGFLEGREDAGQGERGVVKGARGKGAQLSNRQPCVHGPHAHRCARVSE